VVCVAGSEGVATAYRQEPLQWMLLQFQSPVYCSMGSLIIASKLEAEAKDPGAAAGSAASCRLAFYGPLKASLGAEASLDTLRLFRWKQKVCEVHRPVDVRADGACFEAIGWKLYSKNASIKPFLGLKLEKEDGEAVGLIHGPFGSTDKFKIRFPSGVMGVTSGMKLVLRFKRYVYDSDKSMKQRGIELVGGAVDDHVAPPSEDADSSEIAVEGGRGENSRPDASSEASDFATHVDMPKVVAHVGSTVAAGEAPAVESKTVEVKKVISLSKSVTATIAADADVASKKPQCAPESASHSHPSRAARDESTSSLKKLPAAVSKPVDIIEESVPETPPAGDTPA
jgi:hypothetical protein